MFLSHEGDTMNSSKQHRSTKVRAVIAAIAVASVPVTVIAAPAALGTVPTSTTNQTAQAANTVTKAAARTTAACPRTWGSLPEAGGRGTLAPFTSVRTGRHACFDRLVIDVAGRPGGYDVRYVREVRQDGSGQLVPLRGGAKLQVVVRAPAYTDAGRPTYQPRRLPAVAGYQTFRQVAWAGSFEGQTMVGLGVRARLPFRVFTLAGPGSHSRLVVDVAHRW